MTGDNPRQAPRNSLEAFANAVYSMVDIPVTWFREKIVVSNRPKYNYYHRKFRRVPTIDECYEGDMICFYEANEQFKRDKMVDNEVLNILRQRRDDCVFYEKPDHKTKCKKVIEDYDTAATNWFIKYGDLGYYGSVKDAYMKQKHRLIWERQHCTQQELEDSS